MPALPECPVLRSKAPIGMQASDRHRARADAPGIEVVRRSRLLGTGMR